MILNIWWKETTLSEDLCKVVRRICYSLGHFQSCLKHWICFPKMHTELSPHHTLWMKGMTLVLLRFYQHFPTLPICMVESQWHQQPSLHCIFTVPEEFNKQTIQHRFWHSPDCKLHPRRGRCFGPPWGGLIRPFDPSLRMVQKSWENRGRIGCNLKGLHALLRVSQRPSSEVTMIGMSIYIYISTWGDFWFGQLVAALLDTHVLYDTGFWKMESAKTIEHPVPFPPI